MKYENVLIRIMWAALLIDRIYTSCFIHTRAGDFRYMEGSYVAVAKLAPSRVMKCTGSTPAPLQLGSGIAHVCEVAVHVARSFLSTLPKDKIMLKLDFKNAFNCIRRNSGSREGSHSRDFPVCFFPVILLHHPFSFRSM